jgi:hypothetical protein
VRENPLDQQIGARRIPHQHAAALERAPDSLGQPFDERLQLGLARRHHAPKHRRLGADEIRAIEHEHVKVNGTLNVGAVADIALLELLEGDFEFVDNYDNKIKGRQRLFPAGTVLAGKRV